MQGKKYKTKKERLEAKRASAKKWRLKNIKYSRKKSLEWAKNNPLKIKLASEKYKRTKKGKLKIKEISKKNYQKLKKDPKYKKRIKDYKKKYQKLDKYKKYQKLYKKRNKEYFKEYMKKYADNPNYIKYKKKYTKSQRGIEARKRYKRSESFKKNFQKRMKNDPKFRIMVTLRNQLVNRMRYYLNKKKDVRTLDILGCDVVFFKKYIEKKFKKGMNWKNWGQKGWHLDHIKPVSKFDLTKKREQKKCFHYSNLQPLWAKENLKKKDNYL